MYGKVTVEGRGPAVVMAHGTMMDRSMFAPQFEALKDAYRVVAYDQRARTNAFDAAYNLTDLADDCHALLNELKIESCVLLGMSMGGFMATEFIRRFADRVSALVLVGSQIGAYPECEQAKRMVEFQKFDSDGRISPELARETASYIFGAHTLQEKPALVAEWVRRWSNLPARSVLREAQSWLSKDDYTMVARQFEKPVLVIHGENDAVLPVEEKTAMMREAFASVEIVRVPDAGHVVNLEAPEHTNVALRGFLDRLNRQGKLG